MWKRKSTQSLPNMSGEGWALDIPFFNSRSVCPTKRKGPSPRTKHPFTSRPQSLYRSSQPRMGGGGSLLPSERTPSLSLSLPLTGNFMAFPERPPSFSQTSSRFQARWWAFWSHYSMVPSLPCFAARFIAGPHHNPNQEVVWSLSQSLLSQNESVFSCLALNKWSLGL